MEILTIFCITFSVIITISGGSPLGGNSVPFWRNPCGGVVEVFEVGDVEELKDIQMRSVRKIRQQLKLSQSQIIHYDIDTILIDVSMLQLFYFLFNNGIVYRIITFLILAALKSP